MSYPDPFEEKSPWDENLENSAPNKENVRMTDTAPVAGPAPFKIGFTLKAASGYDAEWLTPTVWGQTAEETAKRGSELLTALKAEGLIDLTAKAAEYTRGQYLGGSAGGGSAPKKFQGGKVQPKKPSVADDDCPHGRNLVEKANWAALFCNGDDGDKCEPLWRQKDGSYKAK